MGNHNLMESLWREGPEIPCHLARLDASLRVSLLGMDEIWELNWISDEEYRRVVSYHIVVALLSIELKCEASWISVAVVGSTFSCYSRETKEDRSSLSDSVQEVCSCESANIVSNFKISMSTSSLSMDNSFRNTLTSEMGHLVHQVEILHKEGTSWTG